MCCLAPTASSSDRRVYPCQTAVALLTSTVAGCTTVITAPGGKFHTVWRAFVILVTTVGQQQHDPAKRDINACVSSAHLYLAPLSRSSAERVCFMRHR